MFFWIKWTNQFIIRFRPTTVSRDITVDVCFINGAI